MSDSEDINLLQKEFEEESLRTFQLKTQFEEAAQRLYAMERKLRQIQERSGTQSSAPQDASTPQNTDSLDSTTKSQSTNTTNLPSFLRHAAKRARVRKAVRVEDNHLLSHVTVALVRTEGAVNIGQICRMAANLGVTDIRLVAPQCDHTSSDGRRYAHHALPLLSALPVYSSIEECASDCDLIIGSSARDVKLRGCTFIEPQEVPLACAKEGIWGRDVTQVFERSGKRARTGEHATDAAERVGGDSEDDDTDEEEEADEDTSKSAALTALARTRSRPKRNFIAAGPRVCILFGNEATGLTHAELSLSRYCIYIPTRGAYPSLNLAHAVTTVLFSIWLTGHPHHYWPQLAPSGLGIGSGQFKTDAVAALLGVARDRDDGAPQPSVTNSELRQVEAHKLASRQQVERLRVVLEATMHRWGYKHAVAAPHIWHETTARLARTLTGSITEGDAKLLFGLFKTFNDHPVAATLDPLDMARFTITTDKDKHVGSMNEK